MSERKTPERSRIIVPLSLLAFVVVRARLRRRSQREPARGVRLEPVAHIDQEPAAQEVIEPLPEAGAAAAAPEPSRERRRLVVGITAVVVLLAISGLAAGYLLLRHDGDSRSSTRPSTTTGVAAAVASSTDIASGRLFGWPPVANASAYAFELLRDGKLLYSATTARPRLRVPARWRRNGDSVTLSPGTYRWYVWPVFGSGATRHRGRVAVVASTLEIVS